MPPEKMQHSISFRTLSFQRTTEAQGGSLCGNFGEDLTSQSADNQEKNLIVKGAEMQKGHLCILSISESRVQDWVGDN